MLRLEVQLRALMGIKRTGWTLAAWWRRGLRRARLHAALCMLSEVTIALARVQHGCVKALTSIAYFR